MAKYAVDLLTNDVKRLQFGNAGRTRAVENFDVRKIVSMYEEYYKECLAAGPVVAARA